MHYLKLLSGVTEFQDGSPWTERRCLGGLWKRSLVERSLLTDPGIWRAPLELDKAYQS